MQLRRILALFVSSLLAVPVNTYALPSATFFTTVGSQAQCFAPLRGSPRTTNSKYGIEIGKGRQGKGRNTIPAGGTDPVLEETAARVMQKFESMGASSAIGAARNTKFWSVPDLTVQARQTGQGISFKSEYAGNETMLVHEIGHKVGRVNNWYERYNRAVPKPGCQLTDYCTANHGFGERNEEFAEAFAAYVATPHLLTQGGPACKAAYEFLRKEMFSGRHSECRAGGGRRDAKDLPPASASCADPERARNHRDLRETSRHLEIASHVDEEADTLIEERISEDDEDPKSKPFEFNMESMAGLAVQFAPVLVNLMMVRQQQQAYKTMMINPNMMITPVGTPVYVPGTNIPTPVPGYNPTPTDR